MNDIASEIKDGNVNNQTSHYKLEFRQEIPLNGSDPEGKVYDQYTNNLIQAMKDKNSDEGIVIGIYGHWGMGKSTICNILEYKINELKRSKNNQQDIKKIVLHKIDAWEYKSLNAATSIIKKKIFLKRRTKIFLEYWKMTFREDKLLFAIAAIVFLYVDFNIYTSSLLKSIFNNIGIMTEDTCKKIIEIALSTIITWGSLIATFWYGTNSNEVLTKYRIIDEERYNKCIENFFKSKDSHLKKTNQQVYFIFDNLDRLEPIEFTQVLKLVHDLSQIHRVNFIIPIDFEIGIKNIQRSIGISKENSSIYLQKIINIPLAIPQYTFTERSEEIEDLFLKSTEKLRLPEEEKIFFKTIILPLLAQIIRTRRGVIQIFNTYNFELSILKEETNPIDLLSLNAIRFISYELYIAIGTNMGKLASTSIDDDGHVSHESKIENFDEILQNLLLTKETSWETVEGRLLTCIKSLIHNIFCAGSLYEKEHGRKVNITLDQYRCITVNKHFPKYFKLN